MTQYPTDPTTDRILTGYRRALRPIRCSPCRRPPPRYRRDAPPPTGHYAQRPDGQDLERRRCGPSAKDKAAQTAQAGKQAVGEVAQTATDKAKDVATETKRQARNVMGEAQSQLKDQAATQHRNAVTSLRSLADELQSMSERSEQSGMASDLVGPGRRARALRRVLARRT